MKKLFNLRSLLMCAVSAMFIVLAAGSDEPIESGNTETPDTPEIPEGVSLVSLADRISGWDEAYVTTNGYYCLTNNINALEDELTSASEYGAICQLDAKGNQLATIIFRHEDYLPAQIITADWTLYFSYLNSETLELVLGQNDEMKLLGTITYDATYLAQLLAQIRGTTDNNLQCFIQYMMTIVGNTLDSYPFLNDLFKSYTWVLKLRYGINNSMISGLPQNNGNYDFTKWARDYIQIIIVKVKYSISLWTGNASFKVGGSSCTLSGSVYCASESYNDFGTYGFVIDTNPDNLNVESAEYVTYGKQDKLDLSFSADFRGFKPNTTYYYTTFYKFNNSDHGSLVFKYGNPRAEIYYDTTIKEFTTGDNALFVDVVMCIDITGSMSGIIRTVKDNAMAFYDIFKERCELKEITLTGLTCQVIPFGDINVDGTRGLQVSETYALPDQREDFNSYVGALYADGGGDTPESGLEALDAAFDKADWGVDDGYHRQVIILWTDAPYLVGSSYTALTAADVEKKWNTLPSGRRMILFAPIGTYGDYNAGNWNVMDSWTNVILNTNTTQSFRDFAYSLDNIIDELTSRAKAPSRINKNIELPKPVNY